MKNYKKIAIDLNGNQWHKNLTNEIQPDGFIISTGKLHSRVNFYESSKP